MLQNFETVKTAVARQPTGSCFPFKSTIIYMLPDHKRGCKGYYYGTRRYFDGTAFWASENPPAWRV